MSDARRYGRRAFKALMRSHHFKIPKYDLPLRIRPWFVLLTVLIMLTLALLGFTNLAHSFPLNDKLLHFFCLGIATGVFYFIFDVEEEYRRIWFWRHCPMMFTVLICFVLGGIVSEFVQSLLPHKTFQFGDVVANLLGSGIGLYVAYHLERYYRQRREISRLYRPLSGSNSSLNLGSDTEDETGTQLLPLHNKPDTPPSAMFPQIKTKKGKGRARSSLALGNVWDEREELFGVGEDDDDDSASEDGGEGRTQPVPVRREDNEPPRETKPVKSVRWAEGSS
jgi:VanZ family protein